MLNKIELKGGEPHLYAVVVEQDGIPQGSYVYKNWTTADRKFDVMLPNIGRENSLILYSVELLWTPMREIPQLHDPYADFKKRADS